NQLLAAFTLLVVYTWMRQHGRGMWFIVVPMLFMFATTLFALGQLVYRNLIGHGSQLVGVLSAILLVLALIVLWNALCQRKAGGQSRSG
ncbi:MAG: carbon starvation protein A, partial [Verrucomicrobiae bacterium]|nr:carbon starvation protein A [Verrucomicrobiae bacterium]